MLVLLSALSVARPVGWTVASYLQARQLPRFIFWLEALKLGLLVLGIVSFGRMSPLWACLSVGMAFGLHALASLCVVGQKDAFPAAFAGQHGPGACCLRDHGRGGVGSAAWPASRPVRPIVLLFCEVLSGALTYAVAALVLARKASLDLLAKLRDALRSQPLPG